MKIAFAAEITPARTLIPILEKLNADIVGLTHGNGVKEILEPYCSEIYCIGHGRGLNAQKRSNFHIGYLVMKDIIQTVQAIRGKGIELLITCGLFQERIVEIECINFHQNLQRVMGIH